ncbi:STAS domain-containing protein [Stenoxybacter acetivorans]|uniref:STAS domain-containing protein n=1 Tax=Stenoxybacter acetivorans TaxID=422441 RepID=UPI00056C558B|nr:STAS domain-containing protein [Stenoxybacter acetivorans]
MQFMLDEKWVRLSGNITEDTVNEQNYRAFCQAAAQAEGIDLSRVEETDSACVALLVSALREKTRQKQPLRFFNIPTGLATLMSLYEVDKWIVS